jgi:hypothetical protein
MIKAVGLEMPWLPKDFGGLFVTGGYESLEFWYEAVIEKQKERDQILKLLIGKK